MSVDVDNFLMGMKRLGVSAQFPKIGHSYSGVIKEFEMEQQRDYDNSEELLFWDEEKTQPKMHLVVALQTNARGKFTKAGDLIDVDDDDGTRNLYVKGAMRDALLKAMKEAGVRSLEKGAMLEMTYVRNGKQSNAKYFAPKQFEAKYIPASKVNLDAFLAEAPSSDPSNPFA